MTTQKKSHFADFGAPTSYGAHIFRVEIGTKKDDDVAIVEDYGYSGTENGIPKEEERVILKREIWNGIAETAKKEFNDRLKTAKIGIGKWKAGDNLLDRLLGKELCILAWAAETATEDQLSVICSKWSALRPEERWWLFSMTVAEAGTSEDTGKGWRCALYHALSYGKKSSSAKKRRRPVETDMFVLPLFGQGDHK